MAKNKYSYDDDWADIEDYYGDDIDNPDVNVPDIMNTVKELEEAPEEELSEEQKAYLEKLHNEIDVYESAYGDDDQAEHVDHMVIEIEDEYGISMEFEVFGRIDIEDRTYLVVHRMNDPDASSLKALRAWSDDEGYLVAHEIEDEKEYEEVAKEIMVLLSDEDEWEDIPGGGGQWDDDGE